MIILRHGRYISGARVFRAGEILPDTPTVQSLVAHKLAEVVAEVKATKASKKREPEPPKPEPAQENAEGNT